MSLRRIIITIALAIIAISAHAQIYTSGNNPWGKKWYQVETPSYRIVYPEGLDSLAVEYGKSLEKYKVSVGRSIGYCPNQSYRSKMPVILEGYRADANGSVIWTPRRMLLYTGAEGVNPDPMPWIDQLTIHESRHVAQLQFTHDGHYRWMHILSGELIAGGLSGLYGGRMFFEGDAVVAETGLTKFGRGRSADFLESYRVALDHGDWRDWYRWRYGSIRTYTPDIYKTGYVTYAGARYVHDDALVVKTYYDMLMDRKWPFPIHHFGRSLRKTKDVGGNQTFKMTEEALQDIWEANEQQRGPFVKDSTITAPMRWHTEYNGTAVAGHNIYAIKSGYAISPRLVMIAPHGEEQTVCAFSPVTSALNYSDSLGRLYWSEVIGDPRWEMKSTSRVRYLDPVSGRKVSITHSGRFYNPSPYGRLISATEYPFEGGSAVCIMDGDDGTIKQRIAAPDSLQIVETAALGEHLYASGITPSGFGIFCVDEGFRTVVKPLSVKIRKLRSRDGKLYYTSDLNGAREVYSVTEDGEVTQVTNTIYGVSDFAFSDGQEGIIYSSLDADGRMIRHGEMVSKEPSELWEHPFATKLSEQEAQLAGAQPQEPDTTVSAPVRYRMPLHALKVHSWLPVYVDYDFVENVSLDQIYTSIMPGATLMFQNDLESVFGMAGVSYMPDSYTGKWRPAGHLNAIFRGLYPVIETSFDIGERNAFSYRYFSIKTPTRRGYKIEGHQDERVAVNGTVKTYIPLTFSSGGWYRGITPQLSFSMSNDAFLTSTLVLNGHRTIGPGGEVTFLEDIKPGDVKYLSRFVASLRGYTMRSTPKAGVYPEWGIGAEVGRGGRIGLGDFYSHGTYGYVYGYLPGFLPSHGIRLSAIAQLLDTDALVNSGYVSFMPRGFESSAASSLISGSTPTQLRITSDYKATAGPMDVSCLSPFIYIRNLELGAHYDYTLFTGGKSTAKEALNSGSLFSAGFSAAAHIMQIVGMSLDCTIGVECSYNGGSAFPILQQKELIDNHFHIGLIFKTDIR